MTAEPLSRQRECDGIPPNHSAGECPWCDQVNSDIWVENHHRERRGQPLVRADDPDLYRVLYGVTREEGAHV